MSFVNHQPKAEFCSQADELGEWRDVPVHRVNAFDNHEYAIKITLNSSEDIFEIGNVVVPEKTTGGA
ncbi:hypothetical protein D3C71_2180030 [compost metagenome]